MPDSPIQGVGKIIAGFGQECFNELRLATAHPIRFS